MEEKLFEILQKCNQAYSDGIVYILSDEEITFIKQELSIDITHEVTDDVYDSIYFTAKKKYPNNVFFNNLTSENAGYGVDVIHEIPMGSMDELKSGDFVKWAKGHQKFLVSDKLDGCSIILTYINGKLQTVATRGHGYKGKNISRHLDYLTNIPREIDYKDKLIVRGELLYPKNTIEEVISKIEKATGKRFKNGRNSIAGLTNTKEPSQFLTGCHFVSYWTDKDLSNSFELLEKLGFETAHHYIIDMTPDLNDEKLTSMVKERIEKSDYELDGIILTQLDHIEEGFEKGTINPKASRKFKMGIYDNIAQSVVNNIRWQISRYGVFTPVLEIEPTEVCGCVVSNITGHNYKTLIEKHCGVGSKIKFCRAGLVIPYLMEVLSPSDELNLPLCKTRIDGVDLVLNEDMSTYTNDEMLTQALVFFGKKLDIDQLGYGNCWRIYEDLKGKGPVDPLTLFEQSEGYFYNLIGENGKKLAKSLLSKKNTCFEPQFATALGVFGSSLGETLLSLVYDKYKTLNVTLEQLSALDQFAEKRIEQYLENLPKWLALQDRIRSLGITFKQEEKIITDDILKEYHVCFSGVRDPKLTTFINNHGGVASDSWKKDVNILVVKDKTAETTKTKKAKEIGTKIVTIEELIDLIEITGVHYD